MPDTAAILLAAGESRRMGRPKALLPWKGTTLLAHQIAVLRQGGVDRVVVVLGHRADDLKPIVEGKAGVTWAVNTDYAQGKTTSIKAGVSALGPGQLDTVLILNVDQPRSVPIIQGVLRAHREKGTLITIPTYRGKGGHPIAVDPALLGELQAINEDTMGVKAVVKAHGDSTQRVDMGTAEVLWDINTPQEYQEALGSV